jgi:hypothetical protein
VTIAEAKDDRQQHESYHQRVEGGVDANGKDAVHALLVAPSNLTSSWNPDDWERENEALDEATCDYTLGGIY